MTTKSTFNKLIFHHKTDEITINTLSANEDLPKLHNIMYLIITQWLSTSINMFLNI